MGSTESLACQEAHTTFFPALFLDDKLIFAHSGTTTRQGKVVANMSERRCPC